MLTILFLNFFKLYLFSLSLSLVCLCACACVYVAHVHLFQILLGLVSPVRFLPPFLSHWKTKIAKDNPMKRMQKTTSGNVCKRQHQEMYVYFGLLLLGLNFQTRQNAIGYADLRIGQNVFSTFNQGPKCIVMEDDHLQRIVQL